MYNSIKYFIKKIIPQKFLVKNEVFFRKLLIPFYTGKKNKCNVCNTELKKFATLENGDKICPICGSLPRVRRLFMLLETEFLKPGKVVLDFSPMRMMYKKLKANRDITYFSTDFEDEFIADYHFDITNIDTEKNKFDVIICYHILEHIIEDEKAMKELERVLKEDGVILIQTPFKNGDIYEDYNKTTEAERLQYFGQRDHVRIYSAEGLEKRLQGAGFKTEIRNFEKDDYLGLTENERVIICRK